MQVARLVKSALVVMGMGASVVMAGAVTTDGSTSMEKLVGVLSEAYTKAHPDVRVTYNPTGSSAGISAVREERADIGLSSRHLKNDEAKVLDAKTVAIDGIVVVVNKNNPVKDLSMEDLGKLFRGEVDNWKALGGKDAPVVLIGREAGSGTRDGFEEVTRTKGKAAYRQELTSTGDVLTTVSTNANAVGYASLSSLSKKVKALTINGVEATEATVQSGKYSLQRPFLMVLKKGRTLSNDAQAFLTYVNSQETAPLKRKVGVVPPQ